MYFGRLRDRRVGHPDSTGPNALPVNYIDPRMAADSHGNLYVADKQDSAVWMLNQVPSSPPCWWQPGWKHRRAWPWTP